MAFLDNSNSVKAHWKNAGDGSNIQNAYNISSVSDQGTGLFRFNFSSGLGNNNYTLISYGGNSNWYDVRMSGARDISTNSSYAQTACANNGQRVAATSQHGICLNNT